MERDFWNERYADDDLVYGDEPNDFLRHMAEHLPNSGKALDIGAGEGRNALFLASHGLDVLAVDQSEVGLAKADRLAKERGLVIETKVVDLERFDAEPGSYDVISSIFVHLPNKLRAAVLSNVYDWLAPDGIFIIEQYAPDQIERNTGGPKDPSRLAYLNIIRAELIGLKIEHQAALIRNVTEGPHHTGEASVVQLMARKT